MSLVQDYWQVSSHIPVNTSTTYRDIKLSIYRTHLSPIRSSILSYIKTTYLFGLSTSSILRFQSQSSFLLLIERFVDHPQRTSRKASCSFIINKLGKTKHLFDEGEGKERRLETKQQLLTPRTTGIGQGHTFAETQVKLNSQRQRYLARGSVETINSCHISHIMYPHTIWYRSVDSMYIHTELDTHKGVHRLLRRVYKEPVNTLNNRYFHTYLKLHTVRPSLSNKVQSKLQ